MPNGHPSTVAKTAGNAPGDARQNIQQLNRCAQRGLLPMFDQEANLFCYTLKRYGAEMRREGISPRYTAMTVLGLHKLATAEPVAFDLQAIVSTLVNNAEWVDNIGDLGLLLWLCAVVSPHLVETVVTRYNVKQALGRFRERNTMELAWFLAGLAHSAMAADESLLNLTDQAMETFDLLTKNQGQGGIFGHSARSQGVAGFSRGRIGSFADQIYPVYALAKASQAYSMEDALARAERCASTICRAQGAQGQWWWHYDSSTGHVVGRYPVYSVHQHGMAPMGLLALAEALKMDFDPWIEKGIQWVLGDNELGQDMRDEESGVIWRCLRGKDSERYLHTAYAVLLRRQEAGSQPRLYRLEECRPYELGWLLYSFGAHGLQ